MAVDTQTTQKQKHPGYFKDLLLLFAVPAMVALVTAAAVYVPKLLTHPKYDFMYTVCTTYDCDDTYYVTGSGHLSQRASAVASPDYCTGLQPMSATTDNDELRCNHISYNDSNKPSLRYYDAKADSSRAITLSQAQVYTLDTASKSPDGYKLTQQTSSDGFLFWSGSDDAGWYLKNGAKSRKIDLSSSTYSDQVTFMGWVK